MAFIKKEPEYKIGEWYYTKEEHISCAGTFEVGSYVQIIGLGPRGYDIRDSFGNTMIEVDWIV